MIGVFLSKIPGDRIKKSSLPIDEEEILNNTVRHANKTAQEKAKLAGCSMQLNANNQLVRLKN